MGNIKRYISPKAEIVHYAPVLNGNTYNNEDETGLITITSKGEIDAGMGQAKQEFFQVDDASETQKWSLWED